MSGYRGGHTLEIKQPRVFWQEFSHSSCFLSRRSLLFFDNETSRNVQRSWGRRQRRSAHWSVLGPNRNQHCSDWPPDLYTFIYSRVCWVGRCLSHFDTGRCSSLDARDRTLMCNGSSFTVFTTVSAVHGLGQHYEDLKYRSSHMRCCIFSSDRSLLLSLRGWVRCLSPCFCFTLLWSVG